jgi:thiamine monophosphate synthase
VFPIGGVDERTAPGLVAAGARRLAVGAGILRSDDPAGAARRLRTLLGSPPRTGSEDADR